MNIAVFGSGNSFNGGSNGSDGEGSSSDGTFGHGSGDDLSKYILKNWKLSPGEGGQGWVDPTSDPAEPYRCGGGGGGVLINGHGPERESKAVGQGYGGGGANNGSWIHGLPGVILMEIVDCPYPNCIFLKSV